MVYNNVTDYKKQFINEFVVYNNVTDYKKQSINELMIYNKATDYTIALLCLWLALKKDEPKKFNSS